MTINGKAYTAWTKASMDMWMLGAEAGSVIALRMARIATGGSAVAAEAELMVTEKARAAIELQTRSITGARRHPAGGYARHAEPLLAQGRREQSPPNRRAEKAGMKLLDLDALQKRIRAASYCCGTPDQVAMWREDLVEARANNAIDNMDLDNDDQALFAMMLDEGLSPPAMVEVIDNLYRKLDGESAPKIT